jgi:ubiquinone/menaquinone biosynthesis C-methylase UbiE
LFYAEQKSAVFTAQAQEIYLYTGDNIMEIYDLTAKNFDTEERIERSRIFANELKKYILDGGNKSAIEFGCGTGLVGFGLINNFNYLTFLDSSIGMIKEVERKLLDMGIKKARAICCDLMEVIPKNLSADYIFSSLVLHHIIETESILTRLFNLLNKNGHLLIIDVDTDGGNFHAHRSDFNGHNGFKQSILKYLCKKIGFRETKIKTFYHNCRIINGDEKPYSLFIMDAVK